MIKGLGISPPPPGNCTYGCRLLWALAYIAVINVYRLIDVYELLRTRHRLATQTSSC